MKNNSNNSVSKLPYDSKFDFQPKTFPSSKSRLKSDEKPSNFFKRYANSSFSTSLGSLKNTSSPPMLFNQLSSTEASAGKITKKIMMEPFSKYIPQVAKTALRRYSFIDTAQKNMKANVQAAQENGHNKLWSNVCGAVGALTQTTTMVVGGGLVLTAALNVTVNSAGSLIVSAAIFAEKGLRLTDSVSRQIGITTQNACHALFDAVTPSANIYVPRLY